MYTTVPWTGECVVCPKQELSEAQVQEKRSSLPLQAVKMQAAIYLVRLHKTVQGAVVLRCGAAKMSEHLFDD